MFICNNLSDPGGKWTAESDSAHAIYPIRLQGTTTISHALSGGCNAKFSLFLVHFWHCKHTDIDEMETGTCYNDSAPLKFQPGVW